MEFSIWAKPWQTSGKTSGKPWANLRQTSDKPQANLGQNLSLISTYIMLKHMVEDDIRRRASMCNSYTPQYLYFVSLVAQNGKKENHGH